MIKTRAQALIYGLSFPDTYMDAPFHDDNWQLVRFKDNKKAFLWTYERNGFVNLNVKADSDKLYLWRRAYKSVLPGYHQNKEHWNTVILEMIYEAVKKIPYGRVATYARVAEMAGNPKMARAVGNALHKNPDPENIPCYRVVNSRGELAGEFAFGGPGAKAKLLEAEGVEVICSRSSSDKGCGGKHCGGRCACKIYKESGWVGIINNQEMTGGIKMKQQIEIRQEISMKEIVAINTSPRTNS